MDISVIFFLLFQTFSEEDFDPSGKPASARTVNLKLNGSDVPVTNANKLEYLDLLAQYRLCARIKEPTEQVDLLHENNGQTKLCSHVLRDGRCRATDV
jgi:hypothetical protein